jgi:sulfate adenylyltransferase subunit 2
MPGMSGFALHRQLVAAGRRIPTILITGRPTAGGRKRALAAGLVSYLAKPFSEEVLLDNIHLAMARGAATEQAAGGGAHPNGGNPPAGSGGQAHRLTLVSHLRRLEAESIAILREVAAEFRNPVLMYSIGKDSSVLLHLAWKAFYPAKPPFPLLHIDTTWKFREMIAFRDETAARLGLDLIVHVNQEGLDRGVNPIVSGSALHTQVMKTEALKEALDKHGFDAAIGGARRDEEKSRAKERIFSLRTPGHGWDPRRQRPELWRLYNTRLRPGESMRVFPLSNWTELDVWQYIEAENIAVVPLYFAKPRPVVRRGGVWIMVDDDRLPLEPGETPEHRRVRFRTLGCYPLTGAIESEATTLAEIVAELRQSRRSERQGRLIDSDAEASMERKKREGYF